MNPARFNPEMLLLARESRDLTQSELAEKVGFTQAYVSQLEHGERVPPVERLEPLADALGYPVAFFMQEERYSGLGLSLVFYRKRSSAQVKHLRRLQAESNVRRIEVTRMLRSVKLKTRNTFTFFDIDEHDGDAARVAQFCRAGWHVPLGPIRNLVDLIESAGGLVFKFSFGTPDIDAMSQWNDDGPPLFFLNSDAPADRIRFSLAHELGHVVMHSRPSETMEEEADQFASELLMPANDIAPQLSGMTLQRAAALKPVWRTSMAALIRRSRDVGAIDRESYTRLYKRMSMLGYRKSEPGSLSHEEPRLIPSLLEAYRKSNDLTLTQVADRVLVRPDDFRARYAPASGLRIAN